MRRSRRDLSLHWFLGVVAAFLIVVPPLVAAGSWTIVANRQQDDAERRLESAMALVRSGASRVDDPAWREQLRNRLDALGVRGVVYEIGSFGKRPISIAEPSAGLRTAKLVPLATTDTGVLAAALSPNPPDRAMRLAWALVGGLAVLAAELVAALWLVDRWLILPLGRFNDSVDRIAGGESPKPQPRSPLREVGNVSEALAGMSIALQRAAAQDATLERERRFLISAIAHDLRTPLFALRGCIQALRHGFEQRDDYLARAEAKAAQLDRLVNDLFTFARL
jgi:signal transduction histidine kinase